MLNKCKNKNNDNDNTRHEYNIDDLYSKIVRVYHNTTECTNNINDKTKTIKNLHSVYKSDPCGFKNDVINEIVKEKKAALENISKVNELIDTIYEYDSSCIPTTRKYQQNLNKIKIHATKQNQYIQKNTNLLKQISEEIFNNTKNTDNSSKKTFDGIRMGK